MRGQAPSLSVLVRRLVYPVLGPLILLTSRIKSSRGDGNTRRIRSSWDCTEAMRGQIRLLAVSTLEF